MKTPIRVDQITVDKGGVTNSVLVEADGVGQYISDVSDDDDPTAGDNNGSDPTVINIDPFPELTVTKTIKDQLADNLEAMLPENISLRDIKGGKEFMDMIDLAVCSSFMSSFLTSNYISGAFFVVAIDD